MLVPPKNPFLALLLSLVWMLTLVPCLLLWALFEGTYGRTPRWLDRWM